MADRQNWFQRVMGGVVNAALPGTPYSPYSGYNPTLTRNSIISGVAGLLAPGGGALANTLFNQSGSAQAANAGNAGLSGLMTGYESGNNAWQQNNQNFDSSGITAEFAPVAGVDIDGTPLPATNPNPTTAPAPGQGQNPPSQLAGIVTNGPRDTRTGNSAGSSVLAEGQAAQDMVGGMQLSSWLNGSAAASRAAMDRMFAGHVR